MESDSFNIESVLSSYEDRFSHKISIDRLVEFWDDLDSQTSRFVPTEGSVPLVSYPVPIVSDDGTCSLHAEFQKEPFVVNRFLPQSTMSLYKYYDFVVSELANVTESDWAGLYLRVSNQSWDSRLLNELDTLSKNSESLLIKVAYRGKPSRAIFPIHKDFVAKSNNVNALWNNKIILIKDVKQHAAQGGSYYQCDPVVQSELCIPVTWENKVIGLIDLEGFHKDQFSERDIGYALVAAQFIARLLARCSAFPA